ncbi:MAG: hypothetical protein H6739_14835 [Alphaproteobacteria bacterium]|nr:hypothetical protein [Alphaproteobacteria bacterium]
MAAPAPNPQPERYGTFKGVFTPTLLTILGVIMYLRLGWVVGNAGLLGAWAVILLAVGITSATGLSLSSIATNTRMGAGGAFAIISRSLGIEIGGSVGLPLYLSQALAVAMYVFGFREGVVWVLDAPALAVDLLVFALIFAIAFRSASFAFLIQYAILGVIAFSLLLVVASPALGQASHAIVWMGEWPGAPEDGFQGTGFWGVFAVFFPAATGIMAGANMSGELADPRRSIPRGTLGAIALSTVVYLALAWWLARVATPEELVSDYQILFEKALWGKAALVGLLGATFSSGLSSLVGAPRILAAMAGHGFLPGSAWLARPAPNGEPRNAMLVTGVIVLGALMMRDLNAIAPLITMFFLIAYGVINLVVLVESSLGLVSFRPELRIHPAIPLAGLVGCVFAMFIVNPGFSLISVTLVLALYGVILRWARSADVDDVGVRSSIFEAVSEWAAARVTEYNIHENPRAWKPNLLVPVQDTAELRGTWRFLLDFGLPEGSVKLLGLAEQRTVEQLSPGIAALARGFQEKHLFCTWSVVDATDYGAGVVTGLQALQSAFFRPNILFLALPDLVDRREQLVPVITAARRTRVSVMLLALHPQAGLGRTGVINLWVRPQDPGLETSAALELGNLDLAVLSGFRLHRAWGAELNLVTVVPDAEAVPHAERFLQEIIELCRLPVSAKRRVMVGGWEDGVANAPQSDLDIMGLQPDPDFDFVLDMVAKTRSSCLFVMDSGRESALA